jgi:hypothetical protein
MLSIVEVLGSVITLHLGDLDDEFFGQPLRLTVLFSKPDEEVAQAPDTQRLTVIRTAMARLSRSRSATAAVNVAYLELEVCHLG